MEQSTQISYIPAALTTATIGDAIEINLPAKLQYLSLISSLLSDVLTPIEQMIDRDATIYNLQLAVHENCTNIVEHAYANIENGRLKLHMQLVIDPLALIINIIDSGHSFNPDDIAPPDFESYQERGFGLFLLHELMDDVKYMPQTGKNQWQLTKYLA